MKLYFQVMIAILIGGLIGNFFPSFGVHLKPLGDGFIALIRIMIIPTVFITVVLGIIKVKSIGEIGRIGIKSLLYFELITTLALLLGLTAAHLFRPGENVNIAPHTVNDIHHPTTIHTPQNTLLTTQKPSIRNNNRLIEIASIYFHHLLNAIAKGNVLPFLLIAIIVGFGIIHSGKQRQKLIHCFETLSGILFAMIGYIMYLAPLGALGSMAYTVAAHGTHTLIALSKLVTCMYFTCILFIIVILGSIAKLASFSLWQLITFIKDELFIVLGTSSSEAVLPQLLIKLEQFGCGKAVTGLVLPIGYTFNLDGTSIYLTMAVVFIAQAFNIDLTWSQQLSILGILLLTSKGAAAVSSGGFIVLSATLSSLQILPNEGLILLLGIDKFMSEARSLTNLIGNSVATVVIAKWEGEFYPNVYTKN